MYPVCTPGGAQHTCSYNLCYNIGRETIEGLNFCKLQNVTIYKVNFACISFHGSTQMGRIGCGITDGWPLLWALNTRTSTFFLEGISCVERYMGSYIEKNFRVRENWTMDTILLLLLFQLTGVMSRMDSPNFWTPRPRANFDRLCPVTIGLPSPIATVFE